MNREHDAGERVLCLFGTSRAANLAMDEKDFKKHLQDLAHGHHHPEEHDWAPGRTSVPKIKQGVKATRGTAKRSPTRKAKRRSK